MRITTHGDFLVQLAQLPKLFPINCYFVRESDGFAAPGIAEAAQKLGMPIQRIVLTHAHGDHVGSLDRLHQLLPAAEVMISARDARFLAGDMRLDPDEPQAKLRGGYQTTTTRPTRLLADGDWVGSLQVVSTPGHTPGHI
ncbi:MAG TPA: MBL fold metallo-hydrolase, partial [Caldilineaceae bacterium]|nr:MBL fold metallo-hydrolase [Caldilineaceae bacterium]